MIARGYCFTINNPTTWDTLDIEQAKQHEHFQYIITAIEKGTEGTEHIQGYIHFRKPIRFNALKSILQRAHLEQRKGSLRQAIEYCKKEGKWKEEGQLPKSGAESTKEKWANIIKLAREGRLDDIEKESPAIYIRYMATLRSLSRPEPKILETIENEWWVGPTGTGKSRLLWARHPDHYQKELNKWWCGYNNQPIVAIEEWSPKNECTASQLKIWADRYPFTAQIKGGSLQRIRPIKIIVLSNYTIEECFPNRNDYEPIRRRFKTIRFSTSIFSLDYGHEETKEEVEQPPQACTTTGRCRCRNVTFISRPNIA